MTGVADVIAKRRRRLLMVPWVEIWTLARNESVLLCAKRMPTFLTSLIMCPRSTSRRGEWRRSLVMYSGAVEWSKVNAEDRARNAKTYPASCQVLCRCKLLHPHEPILRKRRNWYCAKKLPLCTGDNIKALSHLTT